ncbi:hypothetical protein FQR65_LT04194 [Abscondita terminalis]|nr:hypothetical protein FQR65_LT04194 [Abscondita terminalis]
MSFQSEQLVRPRILEIFEKQLMKLDVKNYKIQISRGCEKGKNLTGLIAQVLVDGYNTNGNKTEFNFIIKSTRENDLLRTIIYLKEIYEREIYVYSELLPRFAEIQVEHSIADMFNSYPRYYGSCQDHGQEAIILEDMKAVGYKPWDTNKPPDLNHVRLVVRNLLDPVTDSAVYEKFKEFSSNPFEILFSCINSKSVDKYAVVNHGDCSISNFLFKYDDLKNPQFPTQLTFLDWQMARLSSPVIDLTCFLFSYADKELRDKHYSALLEEYYTTLGRMLKHLGSEIEEMLPFNVYEEQFKQYSIFGLVLAIMLLYVQFSTKDEIPDFGNTLHEQPNSSFVYKLAKEKEYHTSVRNLILDFDKLGYSFFGM